MDRKLDKKISALDPKFKKKIEELFETMNQSISMLYDAATHDEKTGLYNSKFFDNMVDLEIEKVKRGYEKLSIMMVDIDFFKQINDKYGHIKADEILVRLARIFERTLRKSDIISRFGGEEFFMLLPGTNLEKAKRLTSRLRTNIKKDSLLKKHKVTVSGGLTEFKSKDTKKNFITRADKALYQAKNSGRDKFVVIK